jgi:hypothetical protein
LFVIVVVFVVDDKHHFSNSFWLCEEEEEEKEIVLLQIMIPIKTMVANKIGSKMETHKRIFSFFCCSGVTVALCDADEDHEDV